MAVKSAFVSLFGLLMVPGATLAADSSGPPEQAQPYAIEKICTDGRYGCTVRMTYPAGPSAMVVRPGSYWYAKPSRRGVLVVRR